MRMVVKCMQIGSLVPRPRGLGTRLADWMLCLCSEEVSILQEFNWGLPIRLLLWLHQSASWHLEYYCKNAAFCKRTSIKCKGTNLTVTGCLNFHHHWDQFLIPTEALQGQLLQHFISSIVCSLSLHSSIARFHSTVHTLLKFICHISLVPRPTPFSVAASRDSQTIYTTLSASYWTYTFAVGPHSPASTWHQR